jgi:hypothetical protein
VHTFSLGPQSLKLVRHKHASLLCPDVNAEEKECLKYFIGLLPPCFACNFISIFHQLLFVLVKLIFIAVIGKVFGQTAGDLNFPFSQTFHFSKVFFKLVLFQMSLNISGDKVKKTFSKSKLECLSSVSLSRLV